MPISQLISIITAVVTGVFAVMVFARYRTRGGWHNLAWGVGLALYCVGTVTQSLLFDSFDVSLFRLWYWAGALAVAPWLGQGTIFLLVRKGNRAWISFWVVLALSVIGLLVILLAGVDAAAYQPGVDLTEQYQDIFTATGGEKATRAVLAIVMNTYGTVLLVGGALYSAFIFWRKRVLPHRMWGNILIAIGGLLPAMGGMLILLDSPAFKYAGQLLGAILLFAGFLLATRSAPQRKIKRAITTDKQFIAIGVDDDGWVWAGYFGIAPNYAIYDHNGTLLEKRDNPYGEGDDREPQHHGDPKLIVDLLPECGVFIACRMGVQGRRQLVENLGIQTIITTKQKPLAALKAYLTETD